MDNLSYKQCDIQIPSSSGVRCDFREAKSEKRCRLSTAGLLAGAKEEPEFHLGLKEWAAS